MVAGLAAVAMVNSVCSEVAWLRLIVPSDAAVKKPLSLKEGAIAMTAAL